ncbi:thiol reductant ABC exporter subunit CydD [Actinokineospora xionganensis]|uniref:thiol reductant ABC exporter subunit CydD n=1 Tax=Actinokineospora xionganensis TaxID=2684470 RepID=UPI0028AE84A9|nr:thiol reductant ABC exporter subunit CydD [Actinokineospora xionganensis]
MKPLRELSASARRALAACAVLAVASGAAVVWQAWALASAITGGPLAPLAVAVVTRGLLGWVTQVVAARAAAGAKAELRAVLLDRALATGPEWIAARGPGELTSLATKGLDALDDYFGTYLPALVTAAVTPIGVGAVILFVDWPSAVVVALTVPLVPLFAILIGRYTQDRVAGAAAATERLSGHLLELVRALPVLTAFRRAAAQAEAVRRTSEAHRLGTLGVLRTAFVSALALELIATLSVALVAVVIGLRLVTGDLTLAVGLFVLIVVPECYLPLRAAGAAHHAAEDGVEAVRRVAAVPERAGVEGPAVTGFGELRVEDLRVERREGFAPDGLSLVVRPGEIVRLDSPSGSGKSTFFAVLLGFVSPTAGNVLVDGVPLTSVDMSTWRQIVSWVPQRPTFAEPFVADEVGPHPAELARDLAVAHLLDRRVDDLSAGERQRVALLRALARPGTRLLILDEPTAHLDPATAAQVMSVIERAAESGVAVLLATHRAVEAGETRVSGAAVTVTDTADRPGAPLWTLLTRRTVAGAALGAAALISGVALTALSAWLIAKAAQQPPILVLSVAIVGVRTFGLARAGLRYAERLVTHDAAFRTATDLRVRLWTALVARGPARLPRNDEGQRRLVDDVDQVRDLTPRVLVPPLIAVAVVAAAVTVQTAILPAAGLALAVAALVALIGAPALTLLLDRRATTAMARDRRVLAAGVLTLLDGAADLTAFGRDTARRNAIATLDTSLTNRARTQAFGAGAGTALITLALGLAGFASIALAIPVLDPVLIPIVALLPLALSDALATLPTAATHLTPLRSAHRRITSLLGDDRTQPRAPLRDQSPVPDLDEVHLVGADIRWSGADVPALRGVDLRLPGGSHVAVVGPSGAGKSTLVALLLGFLEPERGQASLPSSTAWCPQDAMLVATSVRENLRLAKPHASDAELVAALDRVGLPDLLDAQAATLSGGEAQRVALVRALLADADLLLLDEPTAHLDAATAGRVLAGLRDVRGTVVHVTHRPEEAAAADLVVEITDGELLVRA